MVPLIVSTPVTAGKRRNAEGVMNGSCPSNSVVCFSVVFAGGNRIKGAIWHWGWTLRSCAEFDW